MKKEHMRKYIRQFEPEGEPSFNREKAENIFKLGLMIAVLTSIVLNNMFFESQSMMAHIRTAIVTALGTKTYIEVPAFMDVAEEEGIVYSVKEVDN